MAGKKVVPAVLSERSVYPTRNIVIEEKNQSFFRERFAFRAPSRVVAGSRFSSFKNDVSEGALERLPNVYEEASNKRTSC